MSTQQASPIAAGETNNTTVIETFRGANTVNEHLSPRQEFTENKPKIRAHISRPSNINIEDLSKLFIIGNATKVGNDSRAREEAKTKPLSTRRIEDGEVTSGR